MRDYLRKSDGSFSSVPSRTGLTSPGMLGYVCMCVYLHADACKRADVAWTSSVLTCEGRVVGLLHPAFCLSSC